MGLDYNAILDALLAGDEAGTMHILWDSDPNSGKPIGFGEVDFVGNINFDSENSDTSKQTKKHI